MSEQTLSLLESSDFFSGVGKEALERLAENSRRRKLEDGEVFLEVGQPAAELFVVADGEVALGLPVSRGQEKRFVTLQTLSRGKGVGWSALVPPHVSTLSAKAAGPAELVCIEGEWLRRVVEADTAFKARLFQNIAELVGRRVTVLQALVAREIQRWIDSRD
ncbi:MAG: cyclic nucleotide-binding domain-containing protein [Deltaproteobacteria bacterium]|nr:MAG: cyclic nucleotide-binding domain-containing protein [Deltaproteobacteria bacterium]